MPSDIKSEAQEIRIRNGLPLAVTVGGKTLYVLREGQTSYNRNGAYICSQNDIEETYSLITNRSVYAHMDELSQGFVRIANGCRAGVCGNFSKDGVISEVSGINIRIAGEFIGCARSVFEECSGGGILIAGPPGSGKTTILRDLIRFFSNSGKRVSVIDPRGEISALYSGRPSFDLGSNTDTYITQDKSFGITAALRTMFPNIIAFDEIGTSSELSGVSEGFNAGVDIITTAHIGSADEIKKRKTVRELLLSGAINNLFLLSGKIGEKPQKIDIKEVPL